MGYILTTQNLTKTYGKKDAAKNINIHIKEGEIYGLIGRNGAGKTTVMRVLSGLSSATSGTYELHGDNKIGVGVLIESPGIFPNMSAAENLRLKCIAMGCNDEAYIENLLKTVGLENTGNKKAGSFSLGMRQRLGIGLSLVGDPKIIILDEPINGLDPQGIVEIRQTLEKLKEEKGVTIMISSHILDELSKLADSYGIIHEGELLDEFSTEELNDRCGEYVKINTDNNDKALSILKQMGYDGAMVDNDGVIRVDNAMEDTIAINKKLVNSDIGVRELSIKNTTLEDYYLSVTGGNHNG
ncbi:MAG: ATP-binding cassette domain-containing protein [Ruminococcus sp.]|jgi:ABC-2 type transport system ATP-binding protein|nr:ATP-binding cassette domain-containing protein [Ruminococcus sp.]